jgi:acyl-CoA hydrolase/RimJ/RimL family protein N-acetyltransferase
MRWEQNHGLTWQERWAAKLVDAQAAVKRVRRGDRLFVGSGAAEPQSLVAALAQRSGELADTEILHIMTLGIAPYAEPKFADTFRHNAFFIGPNVRAAVAEGRADYTPVFLSEIPRLFRSQRVPIDVALIQVSPPDSHGFCSYGVSVDVVKAAAESAALVVAEVNPRVPRTLGDSFIHVDRIGLLVEHDGPLLESVPAEPDDAALAIGRNVASLVEDGSTLQLGIGVLPNAVLRSLGGRKDLGVHTEMFSDGLIDLIGAGVVNCSKKSLLPGKVVTSFCMGTRRLYEYVDGNPFFEFRPVEFTNDPLIIARNAKMVSVNAALEIDLTGQVCADSIGFHFYSGIGGQVDFIRGAVRSEGGKSIIVLRSTAANGTVSRIVPHLREGAGVVTSRGDVRYVATEYGVADLWGRTIRERAMSLISIAHPDFRAQLLDDAKRHGLVYQDQILVPRAIYPSEWEMSIELKDGTPVFLRPVRPTDEAVLRDLLYTCSDETIHRRFLQLFRSMPHSRLQQIVNLDYKEDMAILALTGPRGQEEALGMAHYSRDPAAGMADVAFLVGDTYQNRGLGSRMLEQLTRIARVNGIPGFTADVLVDNSPMLKVLHKLGPQMKTTMSEGVYHLEIPFAPAVSGTKPSQ